MSLPELFERFAAEEADVACMGGLRWAKGRYWPKCGSQKPCETKNRKPMPYCCRDCRGYFSVKTGTVMQASDLPIRKWVITLHLMTPGSKGISSCALARYIAVTQKTAWLLMHKVRVGLVGGNDGTLAGVNETWVGGKRCNKHARKRRELHGTLADKVPVVGARQHGGKVAAWPPARKR